jgi:hypothetical protein
VRHMAVENKLKCDYGEEKPLHLRI